MDSDKLDLALESFHNHDYETASQIYSDLVAEDPYNPYLLINAGISDYKNQNIGKALVKLYRAKMILPRNKIIKNNIGIIENKIQLNNPSIYSLNFITFTESLILVLIFNILFLLKSRISQNKIWKFTVSSLFVLSLLVAGLSLVEQKLNSYAVVTSISSDTYSGNNDAYSKLYELLDGQMVKIIRKEQDWSQIKYNNGIAWIRNEEIDFI